jgi:hypothetical protein
LKTLSFPIVKRALMNIAHCIGSSLNFQGYSTPDSQPIEHFLRHPLAETPNVAQGFGLFKNEPSPEANSTTTTGTDARYTGSHIFLCFQMNLRLFANFVIPTVLLKSTNRAISKRSEIHPCR